LENVQIITTIFSTLLTGLGAGGCRKPYLGVDLFIYEFFNHEKKNIL